MGGNHGKRVNPYPFFLIALRNRQNPKKMVAMVTMGGSHGNHANQVDPYSFFLNYTQEQTKKPVAMVTMGRNHEW